jgi:tetratricopeptide (TPR) repeat protein
MPRRPGPAALIRLVAALAACWPLSAPLHAQGRVDHVPGVVRSEEGEPLRGATIVAENARAKPHLFATTTDGEGNFYLSGLPAGAWTFTVTARGYLPFQRVILLPKGRTVPAIEVSLRKGEWQPPPPLQEGSLAGVSLFRLQTALQNADTLMRAGQYDAAIAIYQDVLSQAPALTRANLAVADAWRMKKDFDRSAAAYRAVLAAEPGNEMAVLGLSTVEVDRGALDEAERILTGAASRPKAGREILCALGDVKLARQQPGAAADWYARAADADPAWARPPLKLGLLAASRGDAAAVGLLEKAIRLGPGSPEADEAARALSALKK